jgi:hypothetical protein
MTMLRRAGRRQEPRALRGCGRPLPGGWYRWPSWCSARSTWRRTGACPWGQRDVPRAGRGARGFPAGGYGPALLAVPGAGDGRGGGHRRRGRLGSGPVQREGPASRGARAGDAGARSSLASTKPVRRRYFWARHPATAAGSVHHVQAVSSRATPSPPARRQAAWSRSFLGMGKDETTVVFCISEQQAGQAAAADPGICEAVRRRDARKGFLGLQVEINSIPGRTHPVAYRAGLASAGSREAGRRA